MFAMVCHAKHSELSRSNVSLSWASSESLHLTSSPLAFPSPELIDKVQFKLWKKEMSVYENVGWTSISSIRSFPASHRQTRKEGSTFLIESCIFDSMHNEMDLKATSKAGISNFRRNFFLTKYETKYLFNLYDMPICFHLAMQFFHQGLVFCCFIVSVLK